MKNNNFKIGLFLIFQIFSILKSELIETNHSESDGIYFDNEYDNLTDSKGYILPAFQYGYNPDTTNWIDSAKNDISYPYYYDNDFPGGSSYSLKALNINPENNEKLGYPFETRYSLNGLNDDPFNKWTFKPKAYLNSDNFEKNNIKTYLNFVKNKENSNGSASNYFKLSNNFDEFIKQEKEYSKDTYEYNNNNNYYNSRNKKYFDRIFNNLKF